jgi:hypothetical protein
VTESKFESGLEQGCSSIHTGTASWDTKGNLEGRANWQLKTEKTENSGPEIFYGALAGDIRAQAGIVNILQ